MSNPYDLSSGNKGLRALATMEQIRHYRESARYIRALNLAYDPLDPDIMHSNRRASELEKKAQELARQTRSRI